MRSTTRQGKKSKSGTRASGVKTAKRVKAEVVEGNSAHKEKIIPDASENEKSASRGEILDHDPEDSSSRSFDGNSEGNSDSNSDNISEADPWLPAVAPISKSRALAASDPVALYLQEIRKYPLLTREQEQELAKKYFDSKDPVAAQALVTANLRFVVKVAAEYSKFGARMIDLIQEGNMGLMHAVRDFNPYKGVRLITYAVWWIRGYIQEYLLKQYSMVKIATTLNQKKLFYRLQKEKEALDAMGELPNTQLISQRMGIPVEEVEQMQQRLSGRDLSLDQPLSSDSPGSLLDLQRGNNIDLDEQIANNEQLAMLKEKLEVLRPQLSDREKIILEERLLSEEPLTLQEIGEKYGITREAVRQMETRVMKKIRDLVAPEKN